MVEREKKLIMPFLAVLSSWVNPGRHGLVKVINQSSSPPAPANHSKRGSRGEGTIAACLARGSGHVAPHMVGFVRGFGLVTVLRSQPSVLSPRPPMAIQG